MAVAPTIQEEKGYGPNGSNVAQLVSRLSKADWFSSAGTQNGRVEVEKAIRTFAGHFFIENDQIEWMSTDQLVNVYNGMSLTQSPMWVQVERIPKMIRSKMEELGRLEHLAFATETVPEILYHSSFDGVFREFGKYGASLVKTVVGSILYICGLACAWELIADVEGWTTNPFLPLIDVIEQGHWIIGYFDHQFLVV